MIKDEGKYPKTDTHLDIYTVYTGNNEVVRWFVDL